MNQCRDFSFVLMHQRVNQAALYNTHRGPCTHTSPPVMAKIAKKASSLVAFHGTRCR